MPNIVFDVEPAIEPLYPQHGWALNSQGCKLLWMPLHKTLYNPAAYRLSKGINEDMPPAEVSVGKYFIGNQHKLVLCLRELQKQLREAEAAYADPDDAAAMLYYMKNDLFGLYFEFALAYFRRGADRLAEALRTNLFTNYHSAPMIFKELRAAIARDDFSTALHPHADMEILKQAFSSHCRWFDLLRGQTVESNQIKKGLRDAVEHRPVGVVPGASLNEQRQWEVELTMNSPKRDVPSGPVLPTRA